MEKIILPEDFYFEMYGVSARFVQEQDAEFIVNLRTDDKLSRYIHSTSSSVDDQKQWIHKYKVRERNGLDYYFIFSIEDSPYGLYRLYNIHWETSTYTAGSWLCKEGTSTEAVVSSALIPRIIAFEKLGLALEDAYDGCHKDNVKVWKFDEMVGMKRVGEIEDVKGTYYTYTLVNADFQKARRKLERILNLPK